MQHVVRRVRPHTRPVQYSIYQSRAKLHTEDRTGNHKYLEDISDTTALDDDAPRRDPLDQVRISPDQPTIVGDNGQRTYRLRKHGNKPLPIPEIMDPIYLAARDKYKQKKPGPVEDPAQLTPFQRKLASNPFAQALATWVRQCRLTQVRLPCHFLAQFELVYGETENTLVPHLKPGGENPDRIVKSYVLENPEVIEQLGKGKYKMLIPEKRRGDGWKWDKDMGSIYLQELRKATLQSLGTCFESGNAKSLEDGSATDEDDVAFLVHVSDSKEDTVEGSQATSETDASETTWDMYQAMSEDNAVTGHEDMPKVSISYNLRKLFLQEDIDQFTAQHGLKNGKALFMKASDAQMAQLYLEKLQNYVGHG